MKFIKSSSISLLTLALPAIGAILPQLDSRAGVVACGKLAHTVVLSRMFSPARVDHFYSSNVFQLSEYDNNGYLAGSFQTEAGLFPTQEPGTVPFYCLYNNVTTTHLYTTSRTLRDASLNANPPYALEPPPFFRGNISDIGIIGYVYLDGSCPQTVPLFWASGATLTDNFYTINVTEYNAFVANGYQANGIAAWIYPVSVVPR